MLRFIIGIVFGVVLTGEALFLSGAGHGTYAPWVFAASLIALMPLLAFPAGPLLWGGYFLTIPNLERVKTKAIALLFVVLAHFLPGCWLASEDPGFTRSSPLALLVFFVTLLGAIGLLFFFTLSRTSVSQDRQ
jgi:hypothetical protein